jgi:hypothetical protein
MHIISEECVSLIYQPWRYRQAKSFNDTHRATTKPAPPRPEKMNPALTTVNIATPLAWAIQRRLMISVMGMDNLLRVASDDIE